MPRSDPNDDGWQRYEIELDAVDPGSVGDHTERTVGPGRSRLETRRLIAGLVVIATGVALAATVIAIADSSDEPATADPPIADPSQQITTPPTLPSVAALPPVPTPDDELHGSAQPADRDGPRWRVPDAALREFDLDTALDELADGGARRSLTRYVFGDRSVDAVIVHDPTVGLDDVVLTAANSRLHFVIDRSTSTVHLDRTSDALLSEAAWDAVGGDRFVRPPDGLTLGDWIDRLMLGPLTQASSPTATVVASDWLTSLDEGVGLSRRFEIQLARNEAKAWVDFPFDDIGALIDGEPGSAASDDTIEFEAFVGQGSDLILVIGTIVGVDGLRSFNHRLERLTTPTLVLLPPDALAIRFPEPISA